MIDPPFAPQHLKVLEYGINHVSLSWDHPDNDGGSPITQYVIEKRDFIVGGWIPAGGVDASTTKFNVTGLYEGRSYLFRVAAVNQCGHGQYVQTEQAIVARLPYSKSIAIKS